MQEQTNLLLEELISQLQGKEDFEELREQLYKRGVEALIQSELIAHLGYNKGSSPVEGNVRNGYSEKTIKGTNGSRRIKIPRYRSLLTSIMITGLANYRNCSEIPIKR